MRAWLIHDDVYTQEYDFIQEKRRISTEEEEDEEEEEKEKKVSISCALKFVSFARSESIRYGAECERSCNDAESDVSEF